MRLYASEKEIELIRNRSRSIADRLGVNIVDLYACYNVECDMNPYNCFVNEKGDTVACGLIQLTRVGLEGIVEFDLVKKWIREKKLKELLILTDYYLTTKRQEVHNVNDLYLLIFAPSKIGCKSNVLYSGKNSSSYIQNSGLDGWVREGNRIVKLHKDFKITKDEVYNFIEYKKNKLSW